MNNANDYLKWRGDIPFGFSGVNLVDLFLCSQLATPDYTDIVPEDAQEISLKQAADRYFETHPDDYRSIGVLQSKYVLNMLRLAGDSDRFGSAKLCGYGTRFSMKEDEQFAAVTVRLTDDLIVVSFRGTDDTLTGWKEDCNIAILDSVPAQQDAVRYLTEAARRFPGKIATVGHSKGGNLSVFAAASAPEEVRDRILCSVSFDGPGFRESFFQTEGYRDISERVYTVRSQNSLIGILLRTAGTPVTVHTDISGPMAHDGFNWEVLGTDFVFEQDLSESSRKIQKIMGDTIEQMSDGEKEEFVTALFDVLSSTGAETVTDLTKMTTKETVTLLKNLKETGRVGGFAGTVVRAVVQETKRQIHTPVLPQIKLPSRSSSRYILYDETKCRR